MTNPDELKESVEAVAFWLDPRNAQTRKELAERNEALSMWLDKVEAMVQQKLREVEKEEAMKA